HERVYGYYVLPLLAGDRFLGRADLKADRAEGVLRIRKFTREPGARGDVDGKLDRAAGRLARILGLEGVQRDA
ncbi:MAG: DNA glycosylase AlkZ-like family protein, partial [Gaiellaceae bacterium]